MDRFRMDEWSFECNQNEAAIESGITVFNNSFLSIQNQRAGIAYEFHTYEALQLTTPETQASLFQSAGLSQADSIKFCKPQTEESSCSSYIGRVKLAYRHGLINISETNEKIPFEKLKKNDPILWYSEINLFSKNTLQEKSDFSVKVRVMPRLFFCLARMSFFLSRKTLRSLETRVFHEYGTESMLRVFTVKENSYEELLNKGIPVRFNGSVIHDEVLAELDTVQECSDKIMIN